MTTLYPIVISGQKYERINKERIRQTEFQIRRFCKACQASLLGKRRQTCCLIIVVACTMRKKHKNDIQLHSRQMHSYPHGSPLSYKHFEQGTGNGWIRTEIKNINKNTFHLQHARALIQWRMLLIVCRQATTKSPEELWKRLTTFAAIVGPIFLSHHGCGLWTNSYHDESSAH